MCVRYISPVAWVLGEHYPACTIHMHERLQTAHAILMARGLRGCNDRIERFNRCVEDRAKRAQKRIGNLLKEFSQF